jgi:hypothetical protein
MNWLRCFDTDLDISSAIDIIFNYFYVEERCTDVAKIWAKRKLSTNVDGQNDGGECKKKVEQKPN